MVAKIGRNDLCFCGSGKKFKHCCFKNSNSINIYNQISNIIASYDQNHELTEVLTRLLRYMKDNSWTGACHATAATLFVALSEIGYSPKLCVGEVGYESAFFDHSWIEIDERIIDLAISMPLTGVYISAPIVLDKNIITMKKYDCIYGINYGVGLDPIAAKIVNMPFDKYMGAYPNLSDGLWSLANSILARESNVGLMKEKYKNASWNVIKHKDRHILI